MEPVVRVTVRAPTDRFQEVVEMRLPAEGEIERSLAEQRNLVVYECDAGGGRIAPAVAVLQSEGGGVASLQILLTGLTRAGAERHFTVATAARAAQEVATDLAAQVKGDEIVIANTYFRLRHPRRGKGGFPSDVEFRVSGRREQFIFEDRLYERATGYYALRQDADSTAAIVEQTPLKVVVEATGRYYDAGRQRYARGAARATYRYTYLAYSPVIQVEAVMEQDDDFAWRERHFLHLSRKDERFGRWAGGQPLKTGEFTDSRTSHDLGLWGVMYNPHDAAGVWAEQGVVLFDGVSEYYNYLKSTFKPEPSRRFVARGRLYFGPARRDPRSIGTLLSPPPVEVTVRPAVGETKQAPSAITPARDEVAVRRSAQGIQIAGRELVLDFEPPEAGMGLKGIYATSGQHQFLTASDEPSLLWRLELRGEGVEPVTVDNTAEADRDFDVAFANGRRRARVNLHWSGLSAGDERAVLDVRVVGEVSLDGAVSLWRIYVDNRSRLYGLWNVHFPVISGIAPSGTCDLAVPRSNWGILYRKVAGRQGGSYPSANWPMQFVTLHAGVNGLYLGAQDPGARPKGFALLPGQEFRFDTRPENMGVAGSDYGGYYPCAIGVFQGDWADGCRLYRKWALKQAWSAKGRLQHRRDVPDSLKNLALWMLGGGTSDEVVPKMLQAKQFFGLPLGIHWYNWHQIAFDTHYPEYFPYKPGFPQGVKRLTDEGILVMPYINGRLWDQEIPSFRERALPYCTKDHNLVPYTEVYGSKVKQAVMCPYTPFWQDVIADVVRRLIEECGVNAIYIDQIGAAGPKLCFDPAHGHPLGGGTYWVDGYRELLRKVQRHADAADVVVTTENNAEPYMDGVDAFLIWNPRHPDEIPMVTTVYNDYTTYFASRTDLNITPRAFQMIQGRDFIWGSQLGWLPLELLDERHRPKAEYLRRLGRHREVTRKFVTFGQLLGDLEPTREIPRIAEEWRGWRGGPLRAELPSVMGSVWRASDGSLGLFIVNLDTAPHNFAYSCGTESVGGAAFARSGIVLRRITPAGTAPIAKYPRSLIEREEQLGPGEIRVIEIRPATKREDLVAEVVRAIHDAAEDAAPAPHLPRDPQARCDTAWRYVEQQRAIVDEAMWLAAAEFLAQRKARLIGFDWRIDTTPQRIAVGDGVSIQIRYSNQGARPVVCAESALAFSTSGTETPRPLQHHTVAPGKTLSFDASATPPVAEGQEPLRGAYTLVVYFGTGDATYEAPVRIPVQVLPRTEATVRLPQSRPRAGEPFAFQVLVRKNTQWPMTECRVHITAPAEWELVPGRKVVVDGLQRRLEKPVWILCNVPPNAAPGDAAIGAAVVQAESAATVTVAPARPRAAAARLKAPPTMDADLSEWGGPPIALSGPPHVEVEGWRGAEDLSAKAWLAWDDAHLYFAAEVVDDDFSQPFRNRDLWQGDCIQLALRPGSPLDESEYDGVT
ncbi:MAG: DUF6259 domain-containing protein, partial [Armatimonadota bacterium]